MIREDGNVIHVTFPGRLDPAVAITGGTEIVYQDELAVVFRFVVTAGDDLLVCRHVLIEGDGQE